MEIYYIIPIVLFIAIFIIAELLKKEPVPEFQKNQYLLNHSELTFYKFLFQNLPSSISIMCKVRLIDIVKPISKGKSYTSDKNRVIAKHVDFVLINNENSEIKAVIELNGSSHLNPTRQTRDSFVENLLKNVGLPLFVVKVKPQYNTDDIEPIIKSFIVH